MPIDLEHPELKTSMRGYDKVEVDRLLAAAAKSLQQVLFENASLRAESERLRSELELLVRQEQTLKEVLVVAQHAADDTRTAAQKHADAIMEEARQAGLSERMATQQKLSEVRWEIDRLRAERNRYADDFRALLERHQRELAQMLDEGRRSEAEALSHENRGTKSEE